MKGKWSLRASVTSELILDNVVVDEDRSLLPGAVGLKGPLGCLNQARYGIAWGALGAADHCYQTALAYSLSRVQFDRPIAGFQLQQKKLAEMVTELTKGQLLALQVGRLKEKDHVSPAQVSMAKMNNVKAALDIAARPGPCSAPTASWANTRSCAMPTTWSRSTPTRARTTCIP